MGLETDFEDAILTTDPDKYRLKVSQIIQKCIGDSRSGQTGAVFLAATDPGLVAAIFSGTTASGQVTMGQDVIASLGPESRAVLRSASKDPICDSLLVAINILTRLAHKANS